MQKQTKAYLFAITAILFWSTVATAFKTALAGMTFANLLLVSTFISVVVLLAILIIQNTFISTTWVFGIYIQLIIVLIQF